MAKDVKEPEAFIVVFWNGGREGDWKMFRILSQAEQYKQQMSQRWNTALVYTPEDAQLLLKSALPNHKKARFRGIINKLLLKMGLKRWDGK